MTAAVPPAFREAFQDVLARHGRFGHAAHVHLAWTLLGARPALDALAVYRAGLRDLALRHGAPEKYHETLTVAYLLLVLDRRARDPDADWDAFAARHPDLLAWPPPPDLLGRAYPDGALDAPEARERFVPPVP